MYYGRRSTQISTTRFLDTSDESSTDIYDSIGGGFDMPLANSLGLEINAKYMHINFSKSLISIDKYDGLSITIGLKYLYIKDGKPRKGRHRENRYERIWTYRQTCPERGVKIKRESCRAKRDYRLLHTVLLSPFSL